MRRTGILRGIVRVLAAICAWPGRVANWLILLIMFFTVTSVIASQLRMGMIATWNTDLPLLGNRITLAGLTELQWHAFGVMVMLGGVYAYLADRHIRVDILYGRFGPNGRRLVDIAGDLVLLAPFCVILIYYSLGYVERAYVTGERSDYGGLMDRYLIKAIIPIGFSLLLLATVMRILRNIALVAGLIDEAQDDEVAALVEKDRGGAA